MLDFTPLRDQSQTFAAFSKRLTKADLQQYTHEMVDTELDIIANARDADVVFVPIDPHAKDTFGKAEEQDLAWTLGHVIVHTTASSEESAALSSVLARGLAIEGRSRYETPWESVKTVAQWFSRRLDDDRGKCDILRSRTTFRLKPFLDLRRANDNTPRSLRSRH